MTTVSVDDKGRLIEKVGWLGLRVSSHLMLCSVELRELSQ